MSALQATIVQEAPQLRRSRSAPLEPTDSTRRARALKTAQNAPRAVPRTERDSQFAFYAVKAPNPAQIDPLATVSVPLEHGKPRRTRASAKPATTHRSSPKRSKRRRRTWIAGHSSNRRAPPTSSSTKKIFASRRVLARDLSIAKAEAVSTTKSLITASATT